MWSRKRDLVREGNETALVGANEVAGNPVLAASDVEGHQFGGRGLPLGSTRAGVGPRHPAFGYCHGSGSFRFRDEGRVIGRGYLRW